MSKLRFDETSGGFGIWTVSEEDTKIGVLKYQGQEKWEFELGDGTATFSAPHFEGAVAFIEAKIEEARTHRRAKTNEGFYKHTLTGISGLAYETGTVAEYIHAVAENMAALFALSVDPAKMDAATTAFIGYFKQSLTKANEIREKLQVSNALNEIVTNLKEQLAAATGDDDKKPTLN